MQEFFDSVFDTVAITDITPNVFLQCLITAMLSGIILAAVYPIKTAGYTKSFLITLTLLPATVCTVIIVVNGNVGTGVAVAGAFSLVRFRSVPGTAKEIVTVFIAMVAGLICGTGHLGYSIIFTIIMSSALCLLCMVEINKKPSKEKTLRITIPEDLDFCNLFDDIFEQYTTSHHLTQVKTAGMGTMYKLTYEIKLKDLDNQQSFIDQLRVRNGNLEIGLSEVVTTNEKM